MNPQSSGDSLHPAEAEGKESCLSHNSTVTCCAGVPSGWVSPDGIEARMCDDICKCWSCVLCRDFG